MLYDIATTRAQPMVPGNANLPQRGQPAAGPAEVLLPEGAQPAPTGLPAGTPAEIPAHSPAAWPGSETEVAAAAAAAGRAALAARAAASAAAPAPPEQAPAGAIHLDAPRPHQPQPLMSPRRPAGAPATGTVVPPVSRVPRRRSELAS